MPPQRNEASDSTMIDDGHVEAEIPASPPHYASTPVVADQSSLPRALQRKSFIHEFAKTNGAPQILILMVILAFGFGCTVGVVPAVMTDRYARLNHGFEDTKTCSDYSLDKPKECLAGSADSQNAVAWEQLISNLLCFFLNTLVGSISDQYGRKAILIPGLLVASLSPMSLVLLQLNQNMNPIWYYAAGSATGIVGWVSVTLSALSDVVPPEWRAASFGLLLAALSLGFSLSPTLAIVLGHLAISVLSLASVWLGLILVIFALPETLSPAAAQEARQARHEVYDQLTERERSIWFLYRPVWELMILNRSRLFRLLSCLAFFSGMVTSADRTLLIYYLEERLAFNDRNVANMFMLMGLLGILIQGVLLKYINDFLGEKKVVVLSFVLGIITNLFYGLAKQKSTIFVGVVVGAFVGMSFPTISAIKANNVAGSEQGRIQGALYSLQSLANGLGPMILRIVYHFTRDGAFLGPGSMFVVAAMLYVVAVYCGMELPPEANSQSRQSPLDAESAEGRERNEASTPLLP